MNVLKTALIPALLALSVGVAMADEAPAAPAAAASSAKATKHKHHHAKKDTAKPADAASAAK